MTVNMTARPNLGDCRRGRIERRPLFSRATTPPPTSHRHCTMASMRSNEIAPALRRQPGSGGAPLLLTISAGWVIFTMRQSRVPQSAREGV